MKKNDEDPDASEEDETTERVFSVPFPETKKEFSRGEMRDYRSAVARCNYLAFHRFEIAFATKNCVEGIESHIGRYAADEEDDWVSARASENGPEDSFLRSSSDGHPGLCR